MLQLNNDIVLFELSKHLTLKEKLNLSQVNKKLSKVCRDSPYFDIGLIIAEFLGLDKNNNSDLNILKKDKYEFIKIISNFLLNEHKNLNNNIKINAYFSICSLVKIRATNRIECINMIRENNFLKRRHRNYYNYKFLSRNFKNVYALLLC